MSGIIEHQSRVEELEAKAAFELETEIKTLVYELRTGWVKLAERLYVFDQQEAWRALGHETLEEWLSDPEVDIGRRNYFYLKGMWADLVIKRKAKPELLARTESSRWQEVLPAIRRGQVTIDQALADCETLTRTDLRARYNGHDATSTAVGKGPDQTTHYDAGSEPYAVCPTCQSRVPEGRLRAAHG